MNVKPGDLAIVVKGNLVGKVCKVLHSFYGGMYDGVGWMKTDFTWMCEIPRKFILPNGQSSKFISIRDAHLRPVSGLPYTEQTDQQEPIKELA